MVVTMADSWAAYSAVTTAVTMAATLVASKAQMMVGATVDTMVVYLVAL